MCVPAQLNDTYADPNSPNMTCPINSTPATELFYSTSQVTTLQRCSQGINDLFMYTYFIKATYVNALMPNERTYSSLQEVTHIHAQKHTLICEGEVVWYINLILMAFTTTDNIAEVARRKPLLQTCIG